MPTPNDDLELLELHLDAALNERDAESLRARLASDPDLLASLNTLREERALRRALFTALEPDVATADTFAKRVCKLTCAPSRPTADRRGFAYAAIAAAALVAIGFFGRGLVDSLGNRDPAAGSIRTVTRDHNTGGVQLQEVQTYQVTLRDDAGRVVAVQRFDSLEKAQEFAADLSRWQGKNDRLASSQFVVTKDRF
jgi:anti-sigma factor RsiW